MHADSRIVRKPPVQLKAEFQNADVTAIAMITLWLLTFTYFHQIVAATHVF